MFDVRCSSFSLNISNSVDRYCFPCNRLHGGHLRRLCRSAPCMDRRKRPRYVAGESIPYGADEAPVNVHPQGVKGVQCVLAEAPGDNATGSHIHSILSRLDPPSSGVVYVRIRCNPITVQGGIIQDEVGACPESPRYRIIETGPRGCHDDFSGRNIRYRSCLFLSSEGPGYILLRFRYAQLGQGFGSWAPLLFSFCFRARATSTVLFSQGSI